MNENRRSHAASLRTFFDDQIHHLQTLLGSISSHIHNGEQQTKEDRQIVENFVNASNSKMRAVHDYSHKLREHVQALHKHVLLVSNEIPPPVNMNRDAFSTDPLINTLFVLSKDIDTLFDADPDVNAYLRAHSKDQVPVLYALLTAHKSEKQTLGVGMLGDMVIHDVPQQAVNFSSHKIHTPCANSAELSTALESYLFGCIVAQVKQEMALRMSDQLFKTDDVSYESRVNSLANPDVYLNTLIEYLVTPANLLSIDKTHFKLSKLGIKLDSDDRQSANEFDIHELTWSNHSKNVILQVAYTR
ncbi:hypothetical protein [Methylobacter sp.]|uniref:hypothetical protein n=1 Tax=Methylobacter sp. TaxID=2051955 RepID=UPI002FDEE373